MFPFVQRAGGLSADDQIRAVKTMFAEFGLPKKKSIRCKHKLVSD